MFKVGDYIKLDVSKNIHVPCFVTPGRIYKVLGLIECDYDDFITIVGDDNFFHNYFDWRFEKAIINTKKAIKPFGIVEFMKGTK